MNRYQSNPEYREQQKQRSRENRAKRKVVRVHDKGLNGWCRIADAPRNEVLKLYDPAIFWPVYARLEDGVWIGLHFQGKISPTHFQRVEKLPKVL